MLSSGSLTEPDWTLDPGIERMTREGPPVRLALSLHAPEEGADEHMPRDAAARTGRRAGRCVPPHRRNVGLVFQSERLDYERVNYTLRTGWGNYPSSYTVDGGASVSCPAPPITWCSSTVTIR